MQTWRSPSSAGVKSLDNPRVPPNYSPQGKSGLESPPSVPDRLGSGTFVLSPR
jgi:hypothetical protein